jgi:hypothetical protein
MNHMSYTASVESMAIGVRSQVSRKKNAAPAMKRPQQLGKIANVTFIRM